jgi:hypothetical protein
VALASLWRFQRQPFHGFQQRYPSSCPPSLSSSSFSSCCSCSLRKGRTCAAPS